jgi:hypothetical protein
VIAQIVGIAMIPASMLGLQRKTPLIGDYLADARLGILDISQKVIKSQLKLKKIDDDAARKALTNIRTLRKVNDHGWASKEEYAQIVQVLTLVSTIGVGPAVEQINRELIGIRDHAARWIQESYDDLSSYVKNAVEEFKSGRKNKK